MSTLCIQMLIEMQCYVMEKGRKWAYRWVLQNEPTVGGRCIYLSCSFSGMIPIKRKGFLCRLPVSWSTRMYMMWVCVCGENFPVVFCCWYFFIFFRLHWNPGNIPWQEHINGDFGPLWSLQFFIHVCIPVQIYLYSCIFQWLVEDQFCWDAYVLLLNRCTSTHITLCLRFSNIESCQELTFCSRLFWL